MGRGWRRVKMGGNRSLLLFLLRISTGFCVGWTGEFAKPSYKGNLRIEDKNGSHHLIVQFSSKKMVAELDNFSKEPTPETYSLLLSSSPCRGCPGVHATQRDSATGDRRFDRSAKRSTPSLS